MYLPMYYNNILLYYVYRYLIGFTLLAVVLFLQAKPKLGGVGESNCLKVDKLITCKYYLFTIILGI